jgi:hypothetical protein
MYQVYAYLTGGVVLGYLASITHLIGYLRREHFATWAELGQPEFSTRRAQQFPHQFATAGFQTIAFVFIPDWAR